MARPRWLLAAAAGVALLAGFYAVLETLLLQYEDRDLYPAYSTFHKGPLGAGALYGALHRVEGLKVERSRAPIETMAYPQGSTVFLIGAAVSQDPLRAIQGFEKFVKEGGRLIVTHQACGDPERAYCFEDVDGKRDGDKPDKKEDRTPDFARMLYVSELWGFDYESDFFRNPAREALLRQEGGKLDAALPDTLKWISTLYFDAPDSAWTVLYEREGHAVLMERKWEKGSIVLASDSYFLSNEAMRNDRSTELIAWLLGGGKEVIFDEAHLGLASAPGIMDLIFQLRLQGFLAVAAVLAMIGAWMGLSSPAPRREATADELAPRGKGREAIAGLVSLLRRSVPPGQLIERSRIEWERSSSLLGPAGRAKAAAMRHLAQEHDYEKDPGKIVETYRRMSRLMQERR